MRILVSEYLCGGAMAHLQAPESLRREGLAMFRAVVHDLAQCPGVQLLAPLDPALLNTPLAWPANLTLFPVAGRADEEATLDRLALEVDAALVIAPEFEDLLWRRCRRLEELDVPLLGPSSDAVRLTGDKRQLAQVWQNAGVPTPVTPLFVWGAGVGGEGFLLPSPGTPGEGLGVRAEGFLLPSPGTPGEGLGVRAEGFLLPSPGTPGERSGVRAEGQATTMIIENPSHGPHPQPLSRSTGRGEQDGPHPQPLSRSTGRGEQDGPHPQPPGREGQDNPLTSNPSPPGGGGGKDSPSSFVTYPCVLKPRHGAGSQATFLVRDQAELEAALNQAGAEGVADEFVLQPFVPGRPASVAFLLGPGGRRVLPAAWQFLSGDGRFHYLGGELPLPPDLNERAQRLAAQCMEPVSGLRGYVGVDLILGDAADGSGDRAIEINPRLTTSYAGLRALARFNLAAAWLGLLGLTASIPEERWASGPVRFRADGVLAGT